MAAATIDPALAGISSIRADLGTILARSAKPFGSKPALIAGGHALTYQALHQMCDRVAGGLHALGVRPGDRVSLYSPNRWEWVVAYHAALRAGAVVNPINVMLTPEEVAVVLNDCGAAAIFASGDKAEVISASPGRCHVAPGDQLGTTPASGSCSAHRRRPRRYRGQRRRTCPRSATPPALPAIPRGRCSHTGLFSSTPAALFAVQTRTDRDVMLNALPLPHVYGNVVMNGTFMAGATLVIVERFDPAAAWPRSSATARRCSTACRPCTR